MSVFTVNSVTMAAYFPLASAISTLCVPNARAPTASFPSVQETAVPSTVYCALKSAGRAWSKVTAADESVFIISATVALIPVVVCTFTSGTSKVIMPLSV